jgi:hypothetical protein
MWATGYNQKACCWRDVGDRFELGRFLLDNCGREVLIGRVVVEDLLAKGSSWEGFCWRDVDDRFGLGGLLLERCGRQVPIGRVFIGEMWATDSDHGRVNIGELWATAGSDRKSFRWRDVGDRFEFGGFSLEGCG